MTIGEYLLETQQHNAYATSKPTKIYFLFKLVYTLLSTLVINSLKYQNYYCNTTDRLDFFYKLHYPHNMPSFKTKVLHHVSNVQQVKHFYCEMNGYNTALPCLSFVTKATPISNINSKMSYVTDSGKTLHVCTWELQFQID